MEDSDATRLAGAITGWLDFQAACGREPLFSESFMAQPVGEFLQAIHSGRVELEWMHPNLNPAGRKGRPRQVDYALFSRDTDRPMCALEAKWAESSPTAQRLLDDVLRLECVRNSQNQHMTRFFLLSGTAAAVSTTLALEVNVGGGRASFVPEILPVSPGGKVTLEVRTCKQWMRPYFEEFASSYSTALPAAYIAQCLADETRGDMRTLIWRVRSMPNRQSFSPPAWP